jgi:Family of unknown function (DUF6455)
MANHSNWWSAFDGITSWRRDWMALTHALAELEDLRDNVLECIAPDGMIPPAQEHRVAAALDLLLIRMESLDIDAGEVKRIAPTTFRKLADSCVNCDCKERCERDLAYDAAGMVTTAGYCPNATTLEAMSELPWFRMPAQR